MILTDVLALGAFTVLLPIIIWGILNEEKLIEIERKVLSKWTK